MVLGLGGTDSVQVEGVLADGLRRSHGIRHTIIGTLNEPDNRRQRRCIAQFRSTTNYGDYWDDSEMKFSHPRVTILEKVMPLSTDPNEFGLG